jgi:hypothetical protein
MKLRVGLTVTAVTFVIGLAAPPARAEIVVLTSGRTLSVKDHRFDGNSIVLTLRGGGQVTCDKVLVETVLPDEVPYPEPQADASQSSRPPDAGSVLQSTPYGEIIASMSEANGVNPLLVRALIQVESGYRPTARSARGAMGLMQLMPSTAKEYNVSNPFDPKANIEAGIKHLKTLIDKFGGRVELALAAYNAGPAAVEKFTGVPPYRETRDYVRRIIALAGIR